MPISPVCAVGSNKKTVNWARRGPLIKVEPVLGVVLSPGVSKKMGWCSGKYKSGDPNRVIPHLLIPGSMCSKGGLCYTVLGFLRSSHGAGVQCSVGVSGTQGDVSVSFFFPLIRKTETVMIQQRQFWLGFWEGFFAS